MKKNFLLLIGLLTLMSLSGCTNINSSSKKKLQLRKVLMKKDNQMIYY